MFDAEHHITDAEQVLRDACPDIEEHAPVYIVVSDPNGDGMPTALAGDTAAFHRAGLDLTLRDFLAANGRWRGRGFATLMNGAVWQSVSERLSDRRDVFAEMFCGCVLHELGHWLSDQSTANTAALRDLSDSVREAVTPSSCVLSSLADRPDREVAGRPRWFGHGVDWVRACCHLWWRAQPKISHQAITNNAGYGLSSLANYADALVDELNTRQSDPIRHIVSSPRPSTLEVLWSKDIASWRQRVAS
jgi:hypothetical protein